MGPCSAGGFSLVLSKQRLREFPNAIHKLIHLFFCGFSVSVMVTQVPDIAET